MSLENTTIKVTIRIVQQLTACLHAFKNITLYYSDFIYTNLYTYEISNIVRHIYIIVFINDCFLIASLLIHIISIIAINFLLCKLMSFFIPYINKDGVLFTSLQQYCHYYSSILLKSQFIFTCFPSCSFPNTPFSYTQKLTIAIFPPKISVFYIL